MKKQFIKSLALCLLTIIFADFSASGQPFRIGKIEPTDFIQGPYEKDLDAHAVILFDYGETGMSIDLNTYSFVYEYTRHLRLQILDEEGYEWADHTISLYESSGSRENMTSFRGYIHNLEGNKIQSTRLRSRDGMTEQTTDNWKRIKFTFPEVRPGSVIEIRYTISSPFVYTLPSWQFQYTIPVEHSEYRTFIPEFYNYRTYMQGYESLDTYETKNTSTIYALPGSGRGGSNNITANRLDNHWVMNDVPAIRPEAYTSNIRNYVSILHFELASTIFPGSIPTLFVSQWGDVDKRFRESDYFGVFLSGTRQLRQEIAGIDDQNMEEDQRIAAVYKYIQDNYRWDRSNGKFTTGTTRQVMRRESGNTADINLLLVAALRQAGFEAEPVVSSTRQNGIVFSVFPTISRFNYVMAAVKKADGNWLLLDATDPLCPPGLLPTRALNGQGRIITENNAQWIDLKPINLSRSDKEYHFSILPGGEIEAKARHTDHDHDAYVVRSRIESSGDLEKYREAIQGDVTGMEITSLVIENEKENALPLIMETEFMLRDAISHTGDMMFFKPLLFEATEENPLKLDERKYPIDFTFPYEENISITYTLPEGFELEFIPANTQFTFGNKASYAFSAELNEANQIVINSTFIINEQIILQTEYTRFKTFFQRMVDKQNEQISLKVI